MAQMDFYLGQVCPGTVYPQQLRTQSQWSNSKGRLNYAEILNVGVDYAKAKYIVGYIIIYWLYIGYIIIYSWFVLAFATFVLTLKKDTIPVSYTHLTLPTICSV